MTKTARDLVNHWIWAGSQGLMAKRTAQAYAGACRQILSIQDGWETLDFEILALEVDDLLMRFKNSRRLNPRTLASYEIRFRRAVESYQTYLSDPARWQYVPRRQSQVVHHHAATAHRLHTYPDRHHLLRIVLDHHNQRPSRSTSIRSVRILLRDWRFRETRRRPKSTGSWPGRARWRPTTSRRREKTLSRQAPGTSWMPSDTPGSKA